MEPSTQTGADEILALNLNGYQAVVASAAMKKLMLMVERAARTSAAILITGETGSGKELVARSIHYYSLRCGKPLIDLNCAALPEHLVESELFGYEKGAFSGADSMKQGLFEMADKGTLFLDEIGELETKVQVKLLRVLDGVPYYRLGGNKKVSVDVRIVAATNQNLEEAVRTGKFRSDLYHRLGQVQLKIPPLRERPEDIAALAEYFLKLHRDDTHFTPAAIRALQLYPWPGNIRELRNLVGQAAMIAEGPEIRPNDLPPEFFAGGTSTMTGEVVSIAGPAKAVTDLDEMERQAILRALAQTGGHQGQAAEQLGISRRTLSRKLKTYNMGGDRRSSPGDIFGRLGAEQQHYFRAAIEVPILIRNDKGAEIEAHSVNMSAGGIAVYGIENPTPYSGELVIEFCVPETDQVVTAKARIAWADTDKKAGLKFVDLPQESRDLLDQWLGRKQQEEGWAVLELA